MVSSDFYTIVILSGICAAPALAFRRGDRETQKPYARWKGKHWLNNSRNSRKIEILSGPNRAPCRLFFCSNSERQKGTLEINLLLLLFVGRECVGLWALVEYLLEKAMYAVGRCSCIRLLGHEMSIITAPSPHVF